MSRHQHTHRAVGSRQPHRPSFEHLSDLDREVLYSRSPPTALLHPHIFSLAEIRDFFASLKDSQEPRTPLVHPHVFSLDEIRDYQASLKASQEPRTPLIHPHVFSFMDEIRDYQASLKASQEPRTPLVHPHVFSSMDEIRDYQASLKESQEPRTPLVHPHVFSSLNEIRDYQASLKDSQQPRTPLVHPHVFSSLDEICDYQASLKASQEPRTPLVHPHVFSLDEIHEAALNHEASMLHKRMQLIELEMKDHSSCMRAKVDAKVADILALYAPIKSSLNDNREFWPVLSNDPNDKENLYRIWGNHCSRMNKKMRETTEKLLHQRILLLQLEMMKLEFKDSLKQYEVEFNDLRSKVGKESSYVEGFKRVLAELASAAGGEDQSNEKASPSDSAPLPPIQPSYMKAEITNFRALHTPIIKLSLNDNLNFWCEVRIDPKHKGDMFKFSANYWYEMNNKSWDKLEKLEHKGIQLLQRKMTKLEFEKCEEEHLVEFHALLSSVAMETEMKESSMRKLAELAASAAGEDQSNEDPSLSYGDDVTRPNKAHEGEKSEEEYLVDLRALLSSIEIETEMKDSVPESSKAKSAHQATAEDEESDDESSLDTPPSHGEDSVLESPKTKSAYQATAQDEQSDDESSSDDWIEILGWEDCA
ncbi:MAG: hypothetical protein M1812_005359 [Candelaria pacifica]|nr:MAG: hypothetical protein M1812_005359 [Candelaria pacifica]